MQNSANLLFWFQQQKRDLPWRTNQDMYSRWLSEIILQQTRVNQGIKYYLSFINQYPTVHDLAEDNEQNVLKLWQGLGYYSRARNLHKTAKIVSKELDGVFPDNYKDLQQLPGVGRYTAAALASMVHDEPVPAIDGNALRVYSRYYGIYHDIAQASSFKVFFEVAQKAIPKSTPGIYNEAIMELGANICLPKKPQCEQCPLQSSCYAFEKKVQEHLPVKNSKIKVQRQHISYLVIQHKNRVIVHHRAKKGIWQNLYDFPEIHMIPEISATNHLPQYSTNHLLTHRSMTIEFYPMQIENEDINLPENCTWVDLEQFPILPVPKPIADYFLNYMTN